MLGALLLLGAAGATVVLLLSQRGDPLSVVRAWTDARNAHEVGRAMTYIGPEGEILGIGVHLPGERDRLRTILDAQAVAGWTGEVTDCRLTATDGEVTCRYLQRDVALDAWSVTLTGAHQYLVRDGLIVRLRRTHDTDSERTAYAVFDDFRAWVRAAHPELFDIIWVDRTSALYTTPDGARAVLDLLDEYEPPG